MARVEGVTLLIGDYTWVQGAVSTPDICRNTYSPIYLHQPRVWIGFLLGSCWNLAGFLLDFCWIPIGFRLDSYWIPIGYLLDSCWIPTGHLLESDWMPIGFLLDSYWVPLGFLLDIVKVEEPFGLSESGLWTPRTVMVARKYSRISLRT